MVLTRIRDAVPWKGPKALSTQIWAFDDELWLNDERFSYIVMRREKGTVLDALTECGRLPLQISPAGGAVLLSYYVQICESLHRINCIHLNWNLRNVYITMDDEYVAGNFSLDVAEHFPKNFPDLLNGMVADLTEALKSILVLLVDDTSGFLQTRNWEYYDSLVEDYTTTARKIVNNLKNVAVVDYTPLQSIIARLLIREQYNGLIPWRNRREENLLSARASKMIDQGTKEAIDAFQARQKAKLKKKLNQGRN
ncbi:hypothetical protein Ddc_19176 [Ditylenchus destructor]|nr:hypothetical protein Ddc_19176 [Ditylenchus destructor]